MFCQEMPQIGEILPYSVGKVVSTDIFAAYGMS